MIQSILLAALLTWFAPKVLGGRGISASVLIVAMKTQIFIDGNKRASVIYANHYLIAHGQGFLVIPEEFVPEFKEQLVRYYEGEDKQVITDFLKRKCWRTF